MFIPISTKQLTLLKWDDIRLIDPVYDVFHFKLNSKSTKAPQPFPGREEVGGTKYPCTTTACRLSIYLLFLEVVKLRGTKLS